MEPNRHILNDENLDTPLHEVLKKCKAEGRPLHIASEEHGEYVVVHKDEFNGGDLEWDDEAAIKAILEAEEDIKAGRVISLEEAFAELGTGDAIKGILEGIKDEKEGRLIPAEVVLKELRDKYGLQD
jgi:PHD/YefM family antitoxin component YafN of YafNO toxin-antitoxin module